MNYTIQQHGFSLISGVLSADELASLREETSCLASRHRGGARNLLSQSSLISSLARQQSVKQIAGQAFDADAFPVRALFFDKVAKANWKVPWHQDTAIAVQMRIEASGFTGWSEKDGVPHVHPPASILAGMISLRLHLDDCGSDNGPLRVIPGSHTQGVLTTEQIDAARKQTPEVICSTKAGDVLALRPLLLHASSPALSPSHRRVIHIEYACHPLPHGLQWFEQAVALSTLN